MTVFPAIDIKDGKCVRLMRGDYSTAHTVADSFMDTALSFKNAGAKWVHMVDLDGAKDACQPNRDIFITVAKDSGLKVELGGGIRSLDTVEMYLSNGISRVILGSAAVKDPELVKCAVKEFGNRIAVGIDAKDGYVAVEGWLKQSNVRFTELARAMSDAGVKYIIYTDISRDGMLSGIDIDGLRQINECCGADITASGGVRSIEDIKACRSLGLYGVICGKSLYQGTLNLSEAIAEAEKGI